MADKMLIAVLLGHIISTPMSASSVVYSRVNACGIAAHVVTVNLTDAQTRVSVALAGGGPGKGESFKSIVGRTHPRAAITGTFFDTRTLMPTGDIAVFGQVVHTGSVGSALCIDSRNKAAIVPLAKGRKQSWTGYETVLCCGPALVSRGRVSVCLRRDGFGRSLSSPARRTAVGITRSGKLLLVAVNGKTTLSRVAKLMLSIGAVDALSLDGGSSTGFYSNARFLAVPCRKLTNVLVVYSKSADYETAKTALVPASLLPKIAARPVQLDERALSATTVMPVFEIGISEALELH